MIVRNTLRYVALQEKTFISNEACAADGATLTPTVQDADAAENAVRLAAMHACKNAAQLVTCAQACRKPTAHLRLHAHA
eukprot:8366-Heterococcus_DN1.PRE.3